MLYIYIYIRCGGGARSGPKETDYIHNTYIYIYYTYIGDVCFCHRHTRQVDVCVCVDDESVVRWRTTTAAAANRERHSDDAVHKHNIVWQALWCRATGVKGTADDKWPLENPAPTFAATGGRQGGRALAVLCACAHADATRT